MKEDIQRDFPRLVEAGYEKTSEDTPDYNCIAHAADDKNNWWECYPWGRINSPGYYWPPTAKVGYELEALISAFETLGYSLCEDSHFEPGFEKVALYADEKGEWKHAAKQSPDGKWSSKLGDIEDVAHDDPTDVSGDINGEPTKYMKRSM